VLPSSALFTADSLSQARVFVGGEGYLTVENLEVVWAEFSTLS
jgi:hypothetical protein